MNAENGSSAARVEPVVMRADELMRIATRLANSCFVRYWLHWNHPYDPHYMAIECRDFRMQPMQVRDMDRYGFG